MDQSTPSNGVRAMRVCIVSPSAYRMMANTAGGQIGGVEWQTSLTARWFAARGHEVSILTWDEGGAPRERLDGVDVIKICPQKAGLPGMRFFHPKWSSLNRAMALADADLYYNNSAECETGQTAWWCARHCRAFVYSAASDPDCDLRLPHLRAWRERVLFRYGLRHATRIVVQTRYQQQLLQRTFGLASTMIPMPCMGASAEQFSDAAVQRTAAILWVGRVSREKRPDRFLDLALACPELRFELVGPMIDEPWSRAVFERGATIPNLVMHGGVARERVNEFYQRAACLVSVSEYEGFPNTFLEAWSHGVPTVSMVDPDGVIAQHRLGYAARSVDEVAAGIRRLTGDETEFQTLRRNARHYYESTHAVESVLPRFEQLFGEAIRSCSGAPQAKVRTQGEDHGQ